jgi:mannonate dehydratase
MRDAADRNGVKIDILRPVNLAMLNIDVEKNPAIMMGESPQRDRDIESMQTMIKNCAAAGIPAMRYTLSLAGMQRTGNVPGRGDAIYRVFRQKDVKTAPLTRAGHITQDMYWERISYFLERMVPVAEEYKVRMLSHMEDNMAATWQGIDLVHNTVEGAKKFVSIKESPYHGLLFCVGTFSEMLQDPANQIYDVIRYFGSRKKIFMIDFRNISGNRQEFAETFPDDGSVSMPKVIEVLREVGYDGMVCPDHTPENPGGPDQVNAFQYGYIRGLLQSAEVLG